MKAKTVLIFLLCILRGSVSDEDITLRYRKKDFPAGFLFGAGTSAYQVEGAAAEDGRTPSIWDTYVHSGASGIMGTGDIACDQYHKYKGDVKLMKDTGLDAYRFSISWSRLIPNGRGRTNPKGLQYYNNLINELIGNGIQPHITLFHYDLPQALEDEYEGWLSPKILKDFEAYADVCFREFGDRVKYWTTLNEPNVLPLLGYDIGQIPPQRCSYPFGSCAKGNSVVEPYIVAQNLLLAHGHAARLYKEKYQAKQQGFVGLNIFVYWFVPSTQSPEDVSAAQRAQDFITGWFVNPLVFGDYPIIVKKNAGSKLPSFSKSQAKLIRGSYDFLGLNHYTTIDVKHEDHNLEVEERDIFLDMFAKLNLKDSFEFPSKPLGMQRVLEYFKRVYGNPPIYIHENGFVTLFNESLNDTRRVRYLRGYLGSLLNAIRNGSDTRGYFVWSFMDVFELLSGNYTRYGLYHVDFNDEDLKRSPKQSALWYSNFLQGGESFSLIQKPVNQPQTSQSAQ
ncbi:hypothetical protein H6P81_015135 [Aristolochia fimbriata]|uniref:Uncharacterized protein n=1 Tax=Aristolochia fimbriata TaxID=158543 RepID=A0AAV7E4F1_ARIFI|nr:hypothetical protein H6P81_015135 [Aristolochia fimbriata]